MATKWADISASSCQQHAPRSPSTPRGRGLRNEAAFCWTCPCRRNRSKVPVKGGSGRAIAASSIGLADDVAQRPGEVGRLNPRPARRLGQRRKPHSGNLRQPRSTDDPAGLRENEETEVESTTQEQRRAIGLGLDFVVGYHTKARFRGQGGRGIGLQFLVLPPYVRPFVATRFQINRLTATLWERSPTGIKVRPLPTSNPPPQ